MKMVNASESDIQHKSHYVPHFLQLYVHTLNLFTSKYAWDDVVHLKSLLTWHGNFDLLQRATEAEFPPTDLNCVKVVDIIMNLWLERKVFDKTD